MGKPATKKEQSERTRRTIIEAATRLFATKGFASTSTSDLTEAIRMTRGALYWHFEDKDAILAAVFDELQSRLAIELLSVSAKKPLPDAKSTLEAFIRRTARVIEANHELWLLFGVIGAEATDVNPRVERALKAAFGQMAPLIEAVLKQGQKEGAVDRRLDVACATQMFMGMYLGGVMHQRLFRSEFPLLRALPVLQQLLLSAVMPGPARARPSRRAAKRSPALQGDN